MSSSFSITSLLIIDSSSEIFYSNLMLSGSLNLLFDGLANTGKFETITRNIFALEPKTPLFWL